MRQSSAPSSAATFFRRISTVGLLPRVYMCDASSSVNPCRIASTLGHAKIDDCTIGGATAPKYLWRSSPRWLRM
jgi:hypothetical protein